MKKNKIIGALKTGAENLKAQHPNEAAKILGVINRAAELADTVGKRLSDADEALDIVTELLHEEANKLAIIPEAQQVVGIISEQLQLLDNKPCN